MKTAIMTNILAFLAIVVLLSSCQTVPLPEPAEPTKEPAPLPLAEQDELAQDTYTDLLEKTARMPRKQKRDIMIEGFRDVISKYPDSSYARESYYHLIRKYLYYFDIPKEKEALEVYRQYFNKYNKPDDKPGMGNTINLEIAKFYYQFEKWDDLVTFTIPFMQEYVKSGKVRDGLYLFYYSEANFNLKDYREALRGYITFSKLYPNNKMNEYIRNRIIESKHMMDRGKGSQTP